MHVNPDIIQIILDPVGHIIQINHTLEQIIGKRSKDFKSSYLWDFLDNKSEILQIKKIFQQPKDIESKQNYVLTFSLIDNKNIKFNCSFFPVHNDRQKIAQILCTGIIISENFEIGFTKSTLELMLNLAQDPILLFTFPRSHQLPKLLMINELTCELLEYSKEEMMKFSPTNIPIFEDFKKTALSLTDCKPDCKFNFKTNIITKSKKQISVKLDCYKIKYENEYAILATARSDLTGQTIQERVKQIKKLEAVGLMAGGIAHDFNNVLTGIIGLTELSLRQLDIDHPITKYLKTILEKSDSAGSLVRKLMFFSKNTLHEPTSTDLNSLIKNTINFVHRYIGEDISFNLQLANNLETIYADHTAIEQIITNLIINARDAMPDGGLITIKTSNVSSDKIHSDNINKNKFRYFVKLSFKDSGIGMDGDVQQNMYEPFFTTKESERGTGLGLSTVKEIVNDHQGYIECSSTIGEGTIFDIYFPASSKIKNEKSKAKSNLPQKGNETLLVVEDDDDLLNSFKKTLENFGYKVFIAQNGREALDVFSKNSGSIKMIITDVVLPKMSGMDLYLLINQEYPDLHFLLISGYNDKIEPGINYLQKPFHSTELVEKIRDIFDNSSVMGKKVEIN